MNDTIKKIDKEEQIINPDDTWEEKLMKAEFNRALSVAKKIVLSSQKEPPLTIGDKVRESNESLAEFALTVQEDTEKGRIWRNKERCMKSLNQPYKE